jgi:hypothetical protein
MEPKFVSHYNFSQLVSFPLFVAMTLAFVLRADYITSPLLP